MDKRALVTGIKLCEREIQSEEEKLKLAKKLGATDRHLHKIRLKITKINDRRLKCYEELNSEYSC